MLEENSRPEPSAYDDYAIRVRKASPASPNVAKSTFIKPPSLDQLMAGNARRAPCSK